MEYLLVYLPLALIITSCIGFIYMNARNSKARKDRGKDKNYIESETDSQIKYSRLINLFELLSKFPLTSKGTNQLQDLMAGIGVYTIVEQRVETARLLLTSYIILITSIVMVYFVTDNMIFRGGAIVIALVFRRDFINKKLRKERLAVWENSYRTMASLKNEYERSYVIQKAFNKTVVEDKAKLIFASVQGLFKSKQPSADLAFFNQNNPNQIFQRFANLCFVTYYHGVSTSPKTGIDTFVSNLDTIMSDLQIEIDLAKKEKKDFYVAEKLPLIMLGIVAVAPGFLTSRYPGMSYFYNGAFGYISMIVSVILIAVAYYLATVLNDSDRPIDDTFDFEVRLFLKPKFKNFWERRVPRFNIPTEDLLNKSLSYLTPAQYKFRQTYVSLLLGFITFLITIAYVVVLKDTVAVNLSQFPAETMEEIQANYDSPDEFALKFVFDENIVDEASMIEALKAEGFEANDGTLTLMSTLLLENREKYENANYKAWYLLIVLGFMVLGYNIPGLLLKRREKLVNVEVRFEILVLYAIVIQMMYTPLKLRDYFKSFVTLSKLYPKTHLDCYIHQFNKPEFIKKKALLMENPQYYDFMEKLFTIRSAKTPLEVFRETEHRRDYLFNQVLESRKERLKNNYTMLRVIIFALFGVVAVLQVLIPIAQFSLAAFKQYGEFM